MGMVTADLGISLDGFIAGPRQSLEKPMGEGAEDLHRWMFEQPEENASEIAAIVDAGAFIMGRNMFGPIRGEWPDDAWKGWWGDNPPYHAPTFILTHHARDPIVMDGGTTFYFVTDGIESALAQAKAAAGDLDVKIGGGVSTVRQYLQAGAIDELHLAVAPILLGRGESLFEGIDLPGLGYKVTHVVPTELATHVVLTC